MIQYTTTNQQAVSHGVKCAMYGGAGTGKTASLATAPRPFLISVEAGLIVLKQSNLERIHGPNQAGISYDIPVATIKSCRELRELHGIFHRRESWTEQIDTIGLDSISQLAEYELAYQMTLTTNGQKAYGQMADEILECIRLFTALPGKNVIFIAKQSVSAHSGLFSASFPGQLLDFHFPYEFDVVLQLCVADNEQGGKFRFFRTQPDLKNFAKDRTGALDPNGEAVYFYNIFNKISAA